MLRDFLEEDLAYVFDSWVQNIEGRDLINKSVIEFFRVLFDQFFNLAEFSE